MIVAIIFSSDGVIFEHYFDKAVYAYKAIFQGNSERMLI